MSTIDWSKAPEGATHYANSDKLLYPWHNSNTKSFYNHDTERWIDYASERSFQLAIVGAIPRPTTQQYFDDIQKGIDMFGDALGKTLNSMAWKGEGLPPVGVEVDWQGFKVKVIGYDDDLVVGRFHDGEHLEYDAFSLGALRPIKSERDRQIEAIDALIYRSECETTSAAERLYNAGCRIGGGE
jgi:hypothetical protein